jgi:hypothetical protein
VKGKTDLQMRTAEIAGGPTAVRREGCGTDGR